MNMCIENFILLADMIFNCLLSFFSAENGMVFALLPGAVTYGDIPESTRSHIRRWHGSIADKYNNIRNLVSRIESHQPESPTPSGQDAQGDTVIWPIAEDLYNRLLPDTQQLKLLIEKCRSTAGSTDDRARRNSLLRSTVDLCVIQIKFWAYGLFSGGIMTVDDIHDLGFRFPGELGGHHARTKPTRALAEVKVRVINGDFIRVVIDQAAGENAGQVAHGWPAGVRNALIVIVSAGGKTEVGRQLTTRLHNNIQMPDGSHGKQFIIRAAFLKHTSDRPYFGSEQTFSMPLTTIDMVSDARHQHDENKRQALEIEIERLRATIEAMRRGEGV